VGRFTREQLAMPQLDGLQEPAGAAARVARNVVQVPPRIQAGARARDAPVACGPVAARLMPLSPLGLWQSC